MKKIILLFTISLFILGCGSDDSNGDSNTNPPDPTVICEKAIDIYTNFVSENSIEIYWSNENTGETTPSSWVLEIGQQGFTPGTGTEYNTSGNYYSFENLNQQTNYSIYIKSNCGNSVFGSKVGPHIASTASSCATPENLSAFAISTCEFTIDWSGNGETAWEIEYGETGFALGTGTVINTSDTQFSLNDNILTNTTYEVYVRANCGSQGYSNYTNALVVTTDVSNEIEPGFLTGNYILETLNDGVFTANGFGPIFGDTPRVVSINSSLNNVRGFSSGYYPDSFVVDMYFEFQLNINGLVLVDLNDTFSISCDSGATTSIILGPSNQDQPFNVCDDSVLEFTFFELYQGTGGCGASDVPVTIRLTKQ